MLINSVDIDVNVSKIGIGINNTISISNTMKMIARRKNRKENGIRALWLGSNPHSNGEDFSRLDSARADVSQAIVNTIIGKIIAIEEESNSIFIY